MNNSSNSHKETEQEKIFLEVLCKELTKSLEHITTEKNKMEFERDNASIIQQNIMGFLDYSVDLIKELEEAHPSKSPGKKEYVQEKYFLFEIIRILNKQVGHLESIISHLEDTQSSNLR